MLVVYILIALLVITGLILYMRRFITRTAGFWKADVTKKRNKRIIFIASIVIGIFSVNIFSRFALIVLHMILGSFITEGIDLVVKLVKRKNYDSCIWKKVFACGLVPLLAALGIFAYGYYNIRQVIQTDYSLESDKIVSENGYKVVLIGDIHYGTTTHKESVEDSVKRINALNPDLVILDGDMVDESTTKDEVAEIFEVLSGLKSTYGSYFVYGNHDKSSYSINPNYTVEFLDEQILSNDITILRDETAIVTDDLFLIGRSEDIQNRAEISSMIGDAQGRYVITLDHQPIDYQENIDAGVDLIVSGHTHAGQIYPMGYFFTPLGFNDLTYGNKNFDGMEAIVTSGLSGWGYPIRTQEHSEFVVIEIK